MVQESRAGVAGGARAAVPGGQHPESRGPRRAHAARPGAAGGPVRLKATDGPVEGRGRPRYTPLAAGGWRPRRARAPAPGCQAAAQVSPGRPRGTPGGGRERCLGRGAPSLREVLWGAPGRERVKPRPPRLGQPAGLQAAGRRLLFGPGSRRRPVPGGAEAPFSRPVAPASPAASGPHPANSNAAAPPRSRRRLREPDAARGPLGERRDPRAAARGAPSAERGRGGKPAAQPAHDWAARWGGCGA